MNSAGALGMAFACGVSLWSIYMTTRSIKADRKADAEWVERLEYERYRYEAARKLQELSQKIESQSLPAPEAENRKEEILHKFVI